MPRPSDALLAAAVRRALRLPGRAGITERDLLHATDGRAVERLVVAGRPVVVKWRDDRPQDREALLYRHLHPQVLALLGAARPLGARRLGNTHVLLLEWIEGTDADWTVARDVRLAFTHLGRVHRATAARLARGPDAIGTPEAWAELRPDPREAAGPLVLDPGDLHAGNFRLRPGGGVCLLDFENMRLRPAEAALRPLREDASMPQGPLADLARAAYHQAGP